MLVSTHFTVLQIVADQKMIKGGADFSFLPFPFFFLLSSQKMEKGLKEGLHCFFGSRGAGAP